MIQQSPQILPTVQQIKLRRLQLEVEALWEQVQNQCETATQSLMVSSAIEKNIPNNQPST